MNPPTTPTTDSVPQWMMDAAAEFVKGSPYVGYTTEDIIGGIASIIAKHAPKSATPAPSIWRPVSVQPKPEDAVQGKWITGIDTDGVVVGCPVGFYWRQEITHWCPTADLLALAPLPKAKTQAEEDTNWLISKARADGPWTATDMRDAIAYGRATAKGGKE